MQDAPVKHTSVIHRTTGNHTTERGEHSPRNCE